MFAWIADAFRRSVLLVVDYAVRWYAQYCLLWSTPIATTNSLSVGHSGKLVLTIAETVLALIVITPASLCDAELQLSRRYLSCIAYDADCASALLLTAIERIVSRRG